MKSEQFEQKIRRISECEESLLHQTTPNNAISALEHGLMSRNEARDRGFKIEKGYARPSYFPNYISLADAPNIIFGRGGFSPERGRVMLIIDPECVDDDEYDEHWGHYVHAGVIPPEGVLGMISNSDCLKQRLMEAQREKLTELTPVFFYARRKKGHEGLYVPEWLEVSDEVRELVK